MSVLRVLGRAALLGLAGGLALGAAILLIFAARGLQIDCSALSAEECTFERQIAHEVARTQSIAGLGLACVASGLALMSRRAPKAS